MSNNRALVHTEKEEYISAMARAVNGVAVVSTNGPAGLFGITVSSVSSVSADPPLVLACVNRGSVAHRALKGNEVFCVNLLSTDQRELADAFAGRPSRGRAYQFDEKIWRTGPTGSPRLRNALATFDCFLEQAHEAGSHTVFIGRVTGVTDRPGDPLLYTARSYGRPLRWTRRDSRPSTAA